MQTSKKITKNGGITIPKVMRVESGIHPGVGVDVKQDGDSIIITPHVNVCRFCSSPQNVKSVMGIDICPDCAAKIHEAVISSD